VTDCNGAPCRDWIIVLAQNGNLTVWGWLVIVCSTILALIATLSFWWLIEKLT
jgi:hypothetical protein